jgi:1,4-alpha-glucan branching enzyme
MIEKKRSNKPGWMYVTFALPSTMWADQVNLVGDFNDWDTTATPMQRDRLDANWKASVELQTGQGYRFRYLIDGKDWLNDWRADDHIVNPDGVCDSVIDLTESFGMLAA